MLPTTSPKDAVAELHRVAGLGHIGAIFHCFEVDLLDASWDRLWAAAAETGLPISTWPNSAAAIDHSLGTLGEEAVRKVTGENCKKLYNLP